MTVWFYSVSTTSFKKKQTLSFRVLNIPDTVQEYHIYYLLITFLKVLFINEVQKSYLVAMVKQAGN